MALDYNGGTDGIFDHIGPLIKHVNLLGTDATNLNADLDEIQDAFEAGDETEHIEGLRSEFEALQSSHISLRAALASRAGDRLRDLETVVQELNLPSTSLSSILPALITRMNDDSENVDASTVTLGTVTANGSNVGTGTVLVSKVLDGISSPGSGISPHLEYNGLDSELAVTETMTVVCTADTQIDGRTSGEEAFSWYGEKGTGSWGTDNEGSGGGPGITVLNANAEVLNRNFEIFTSNVPDDWTLDAGTAGTHVAAESTEVHRGTYSLEFAGDGAQATMQISQDMTVGNLTPKKRYCLAMYYKASATDTGSQSFTIQFEGTGYTAASSEKISITGDNWATSWTLVNFFINMPETIPSDFELVIKAAGTWNTGKKVYFDSIAFGEVSWHNGINCVVVAGATDFIRGDEFTFTVSNNKAGTIQEFFRRQFGVQLPSEGTGSETIDDALAE